jgi:hypothetical protein
MNANVDSQHYIKTGFVHIIGLTMFLPIIYTREYSCYDIFHTVFQSKRAGVASKRRMFRCKYCSHT